jgi:hypothetical protein
MVLVNDKSFEESLSFTKKNKGIFKDSKPWTNAYYKNQQLNNIINNILMKYLMTDRVISIEGFVSGKPETMIFIDEATKENLNNIFMMIADVDTDVCFVSQNLVNDKLLSFRQNMIPQILANGKPFKEEASTISINMKNFILDVTNGKLGDWSSLRKDLSFDKAVKHITDMVEKYFQGTK